MKVVLTVSTEVSTLVEVDIPINPNGRTKGQISNYIDDHHDEIADMAKERLFRNFKSDWEENLTIYTREN